MIEVATPGLVIPTGLTDFVNSLKPDKSLRDKDSPGVDYARYMSKQFLVCNAICDWHTDPEFPPYTGLFIIRNDPGSYVELEGVEPVLTQPVGTLVLLNTRKQHRLWNKAGEDTAESVWAALSIDSDEKLTIDELTEKMAQLIDRLK